MNTTKPKYESPEILAEYSAAQLNDLIEAEACSHYSVNCGCYGGPVKQ